MPEHSPSEIDPGQGIVVLRQARQVAHHCLYYLYHLGDMGNPALNARLDVDRRHAFDRVANLLNSVHLPASFSEPARGVDPETLRLDTGPIPPHRRAVKQLMVEPRRMPETSAGDAAVAADAANADLGDAAHRAQVAELSRVIAYWATHVWWPVNAMMRLQRGSRPVPPASKEEPGPAPVPTAADADGLIRRLQEFLVLSRPWRGRTGMNRQLVTVRRMVSRNCALLLGLGAVALVYGQVGAVHNLAFNMGWAVLLPFVLVGLGALLMMSLGLVPRLSPGKGAFWRIAFPALQPPVDPEIVGPKRHLGALIGQAEAMKLGMLVAWLVLAGTVFISAIEVGDFERTQRTLFLFNALCLLALVVLHWLDHWDFLDHRPVRLYALGAGIAPLIISLSGYWGGMQFWIAFIPTVYVAWWLYMTIRHRHLAWARTVGAVLAGFVAVGLFFGAHTRADAIWGHADHRPAPSAVPLPAIRVGAWPADGNADQPVVVLAASGGGSRAAMYTAYFLERLHRELPQVAANIQAISSVSGGSLASAAYVAFRREMLLDPAAQFWPRGAENPDPACVCQHGDDCFRGGDLVRAAGQDFLLATLTGALVPSLTRGAAIEVAFSQDARLGTMRLQDLVDDWKIGGQAPFPIPLLNACTLDNHAVVLTPLDREYYLPPVQSPDNRFQRLRSWYRLDAAEKLTWVLDRDEVFAFRDLNPHYSPSLAEAVRASANFPFGFPLVEVATTRAYGTPYVDDRLAKLTDGGVLSNSGMWTLFHLLTRQGDVVAKLKKRGVLLLVVDASHMPEYADNRRDLLSLYSAIADQAPIAQNLHRRMFELLQREYGNRLSIVQLDIPPTPADNVLTTWALDNESKRKLRRSFCRMWRTGDENSLNASQRIREHWDYLAHGGPPPADAQAADPAKPLPYAVVRPPLD